MKNISFKHVLEGFKNIIFGVRFCFCKVRGSTVYKLIHENHESFSKIKYHPKMMFLKPSSGFTLMEILVVVVIIGFLATFVAPKFFDQPDKARMVVAKQQIRSLSESLEMYKLDNRNYPTTEQGLKALTEKPSSSPVPSAWKKGGYMKSVPKDPWGSAYIYLQPGIHSEFDILSYAADGKKGGEDENKDITSWE